MDFYRTVFKIALPIIMQNFLTSFVNMIDTVMVGQLGAVEIAAVGLGNQIFFVMNTVMFGVVSGGSIFMSQFWGKKDISRLRQTMGITVALAFAVSMLFTVLAAFFPEKCLSIHSLIFIEHLCMVLLLNLDIRQQLTHVGITEHKHVGIVLA